MKKRRDRRDAEDASMKQALVSRQTSTRAP